MKSMARSYNLVSFQMVSDTKYHTWCSILMGIIPSFNGSYLFHVYTVNYIEWIVWGRKLAILLSNIDTLWNMKKWTNVALRFRIKLGLLVMSYNTSTISMPPDADKIVSWISSIFSFQVLNKTWFMTWYNPCRLGNQHMFHSYRTCKFQVKPELILRQICEWDGKFTLGLLKV
jgi:hypothetical protein